MKRLIVNRHKWAGGGAGGFKPSWKNSVSISKKLTFPKHLARNQIKKCSKM